jgi:hypothetical protein
MKNNSPHKSQRPADAAAPPRREAAFAPARVLWLLLTLAPVLGLVAALSIYALDAPYGDEWGEVPLMQKVLAHTSTFHDFWAPHNEHRIFFPRLVMVANLFLTGWDTRWEMAVSVALALGIFLLLVRQAGRTARALGQASPLWLPFFLSLLTFSLAAQENWFWGSQVQFLLVAVASVGALLLLSREPFTWGRFAGAILLAVVAVGSMAGGLLVWPAGLVGLILLYPSDRPRLRLALPIWGGLGVASFVLYFHDIGQLGSGSPSGAVLGHSGETVGFVLAYLGAPLWFYHQTGAIVAGALGLALVLAAGGWLLYRRRVPPATLLPYLLLIIFVLGNALVTAAGRVSGGVFTALAPRYLTISSLFWACALVLLALVGAWPGATGGTRLGRARQGSLTALLVVIFYFAGANSYNGLGVAIKRFGELKTASTALRRGDEAGYRKYFGDDPALRRFLMEHHLSLFRPGAETYGSPESGPSTRAPAPSPSAERP